MPNAEQIAVAIYNTHDEAEQAVKTLERGGFDMKKLSIVGKDYHTEEHVVGYYNTGDRMKAWGRIGAFWGGLWGLLFGAAFFFIPGIGPVVLAGPLVACSSRRAGGGRGRRRLDRPWGGARQPRHPQEQRRAVRDRPQGGQVPGDRPWHTGGRGAGQEHHR